MSNTIGEDEKDNGMEMENDFEGEMFDVPKGDDQEQDKVCRSLLNVWFE